MAKKILFMLFCLLTAFHSFAQSSRVITLSDAIHMGLDYSKTLKISGYKVDAQTAKYNEARAITFPQVKLSAGYTRLSHVDEPQIHIPGLEGGFSFPSLENNTFSRLSLSQPIFTGFRLKSAVNYFSENIQASLYDSQKDSLDVSFNIVNLYINLYKAELNLDVVKQNITQIDQHLKEVSDFEKAGVALHNDVLKVELQKSNSLQLQLDAQNAVSSASFNLALQLGLQGETQILVDSTGILRSLNVQPYDYYLQEALKNRPDLKANDTRTQAAMENVKIAKGSYYPQVNLNANGYYSNPNPRLIPEEYKWVGTWDVGVGLSWDISGLFTNKYQMDEASANVLQLQTLHDQQVDGVKSEVYQNYLAVVSAREKVSLSQQALQDAVENYNTENNRYVNQLVLLSDLTDANRDLLVARFNAVNTKADAVLSFYRLLESTGTSPIK